MIEHMSPTRFDRWCKCELQGQFVDLEGLRSPPGIAAHAGSGLHGAAAINFRRQADTGEPMPIGEWEDAAATEYNRRLHQDGLLLPRADLPAKARIMGNGRDRAVRLARGLAAKARDFAPVGDLVERRVVIETELLPVAWVGVFDLGTADGVVVDWKGAWKRWRKGREHTETQPTVYRELFRAATGAYPRETLFGVLVSPERKSESPNESADYEARPTERTADDWRALNARATGILRTIQSGIFRPAVYGRDWWCSPKWCGFWGFCPAISDRVRRLPNM